MRTDSIDLVTYLAFIIIGFLIKFFLERYSKHKDAIRFESWKLEISNLEEKLSQFYWPIHCRIKRGSIAWKSGNFRRSIKTKDGKKFALMFDELIIIKNHEETRDIIQRNFHHFGGEPNMEEALIKLLHHIDVYLSLRKAGSQNDPVWVDQPWPKEVETLIEVNLHKLQKRYNRLL